MPAGLLAALQVKHRQGIPAAYFFAARLVDVLDVVEGQDGIQHLFRAAVPEQENVLLVGAQFIEVFLGQGPAGLDEVDDTVAVGGREVQGVGGFGGAR